MKRPWAWGWRKTRLARVIDSPSAEALAGDLLEEFAARAATNRLGAEAWLMAEMSSIRGSYVRERRTSLGGPENRLPRLSGALGYALRSLRHSPWYAAATVAVIAISIALASTVFAIVDGTLFKPLPYGDASRIYGVSLGYSRLSEDYNTLAVISEADFGDWQAAVPDAVLTAFSQNVWPVGVRDSIEVREVDATFLDVFGVTPIIGGFSPDDFTARSNIRAALVSYEFWLRRLGGQPEAIGRQLTDETGKGIRVVGVLPENFAFPDHRGTDYKPEALLPRVTTSSPARGGGSLSVVLRVPHNASQAGIDERLSAALVRQFNARPTRIWPAGTPARRQIVSGGYDRLRLDPIRLTLTDRYRSAALGMGAAALALLTLACVNVAGLALARLRDRQTELVVRRALGARMSDLVGLLIVEHAVIVSAGAGIGLLAARFLAIEATPFIHSVMAVLKPPTVDARVAVFAALMSLLSLLAITAASAHAIAGGNLRAQMSQASGATTRERRRSTIVAIEVALGVILAVGGALVVSSLVRAWSEDPGFDSRNAAIVSVGAGNGRSASEVEDFVTEIGHLPGVVAAGGTNHPFLGNAFNGSEFDRPPGVELSNRGFGIESVPVTHGFFRAAQLRLVAGRFPTDAELQSGAAVIVVSRATAEEFWPGTSPLGASLVRHKRPYVVVGVVDNARLMSLDAEAQGEIFWPVAAAERPYVQNLIVRFASADTGGLSQVVRYAAEHCTGCWLFGAQMMHDALSTTIRGREFNGALFGAFGIAAVVIVGAGVLGIVAMATKRRTREVGIRMALGATRSAVMSQIVREQVGPVVAGLVGGGLFAAWATRFVESFLYKTPTYDPWAWGLAASALLAIAFIAALVPSRHASRIDPVQALRTE